MSGTIKDVIENDYCTGCGNCAFVLNMSMIIDKYGEYKPDIELDKLTESDLEKSSLVCPNLNPALNEDVLSELFINFEGKKKSEFITLCKNEKL